MAPRGMLGHKQNVFDDFHAAAEWLVAQGWTTPEQLAATGGSNGGLLVGAALTQRPELFAAVVCSAPLLDMVRYERFGLGATWAVEYGSAESAEQLGWLLAYSPYHHVRDGVAYPATLFTVFDGDTRVDPMHARKLTAALQHATSSDAPVLLRREPTSATEHGRCPSRSSCPPTCSRSSPRAPASTSPAGRPGIAGLDGVLAAVLVRLASAAPTPSVTPTPTPGGSGSLTTASDVWNWLLGAPLRILLIVVIAVVARAVAHRLIDGVVRTMTNDGRAHERPGADRRPGAGGLTSLQLLSERRRQRAETMGSLLRSIASVVILGLASASSSASSASTSHRSSRPRASPASRSASGRRRS